MSEDSAIELYRKYRPQSLEELVGQDEVVEMLESMIEKKRVPHCILASGPSGCGKTTVFRILKSVLDCSQVDFKEVNAATSRGIEMTRDIQSSIGLSPLKGSAKIWLIDEAHQLTGPAQESMLKTLEDIPSHVYFFLASTDPQKLKKTIMTRCSQLKFKSIDDRDLIGLCNRVCSQEANKKLPESIGKAICKVAEGSARKALVLLHQVIDRDFSDEEGVIELIENSDSKREAIEICRALINPRTSWSEMAKILKEVEEDPEQIRWLVLSYMSKIVLSGGRSVPRAIAIMDQFRDNFYDCKKAGLILACHAIVEGD